ncbi:MAG TPA: hypothetical protein PLI62_06055, partial [Spirochaetota bacterium]|nr:hypothetical protein [Spirochaetota bacterium]
MGTTAVQEKRKILFDVYFPDEGTVSADFDDEKFQRKFLKLRRDVVRTVFIVTKGVSDSYKYLRFMREFERRGFLVKSIYLPDLSPDRIAYIRNTVEDIVESFRDGSTLVLSYGPGYAGVIIASYVLFSGNSLRNAIKRVRMIHPSLLESEKELNFLSLYREKTGTGAADDEEMEGESEETEIAVKKEIHGVPEKKAVHEEPVKNEERTIKAEAEPAVAPEINETPGIQAAAIEKKVSAPVEETVPDEPVTEVPVSEEEKEVSEPAEVAQQEPAEEAVPG